MAEVLEHPKLTLEADDPFEPRWGEARLVVRFPPELGMSDAHDPATLSGEEVLRGFTLKVTPVWRKLGAER